MFRCLCTIFSKLPTSTRGQNRTFALHIQPLPHFINNTDFTIHRPNAIYRGAVKSLARPGRKQTTATKLSFASR